MGTEKLLAACHAEIAALKLEMYTKRRKPASATMLKGKAYLNVEKVHHSKVKDRTTRFARPT